MDIKNNYQTLYGVICEYIGEVLSRYSQLHPNIVENPEVIIDESELTNVTFSVMFKDYQQFIENGRKSSSKFPPIITIQQWIDNKSKLPSEPNLSKIGKNGYSQLAFLIARKIKNYGYSGKHELENIINEIKPNYLERFENALLEDTKKLFIF